VDKTCANCAHWNDKETPGTVSRRCLQPRLTTELLFAGRDDREVLPVHQAFIRPIRTSPDMSCPLWTRKDTPKTP